MSTNKDNITDWQLLTKLLWQPVNAPYTLINHHEKITSINQFPKDAYGFVYCITFDDDTKYIGKKALYTIQRKKALKDGTSRKDAISKVLKNTGKGHRIEYEIVKSESNWKKYQGSCKECKAKTPKTKEILAIAFSKQHLTYLETKYQFLFEVLENPTYLNDNILGSFYRSVFNGIKDKITESSESNKS